MGRLFESPWPIIVIIIVALLLFGAPKLPGMARSLGQSMRIFKSEVKQMKDDDKPKAEEPSEPVEGRIVNNPASPRETGGTEEPPTNRPV
ncbi:Sec-independent protein translocase subunit TatA [Paenarthrobacter sp. DKR-5]|uniref:Sec-independent protein translocase subunit TatA n=1 Tax=Paenarthrobacter sp. DKR-5 TaxID=2835535 RepID=UPI001BDC71C5|nr:Sec-independent protein translocase subunit TatA [Paenarthrobacter sp. DKR-5]MBT1001769.1 Sec-independent protein translocase subunit TatA [Paenarthrobacter sp. DKR-5]